MHSTSASIKIFTIELAEGKVPGNEDEIKVTDKRKFDKDGNVKEDAPASDRKVKVRNPDAATAHEQSGSDKTESQTKKNIEKNEENKREQHEIEFIPFILSLYTSILANLGALPDAAGIKIEKNVEQAKELIDIIKMLSNKTKGNLSEDEQNVIDDVIYQSEMIFVKNVSDLKL